MVTRQDRPAPAGLADGAALGAEGSVVGDETEVAREVSPALAHALLGAAPPWVQNFADRHHEWRRLFAEVLGTFLLVSVAAGAGVVSASTGGAIGRTAAVVAPALMVTAVILATGAISGAHLNPVVSVAFALRRDFPWRRVPLYIVAQLLGATLACLALWAMFGKVGHLGATLPVSRFDDLHATVMEAILTLGLVTTILGTASGAQNVGPISALAVGGYVALAGLWSSPVSGASMNPARSFGPDVVTGDFSHFWVYLVGPTVGMLLAVGAAWVLRGPGPDPIAARAAQGTLGTVIVERRVRVPNPTSDADCSTTSPQPAVGSITATRPADGTATSPGPTDDQRLTDGRGPTDVRGEGRP